jgi:transposase
MNELTATQAFWLGHCFHASSRQLALSEYAKEQCLDLAELLTWEKRLVVQGISVPPRHRPARFIAVEVTR